MTGADDTARRRDPALEAIDGQNTGNEGVREIDAGTAPPDLLLRRLRDVIEADGGRPVVATPRLRGFCRAIQKALERRR